MKRVWISVGIFVVLVAVCILGTVNTMRISDEMTITVTSAKKSGGKRK